MARVLIVDDEVYIRLYLRSALQTAGHQVVGEIGDGTHALECARQLQPDVILLDVVMPGVDGLSILPALHAAAPLAQIVLISGIDPIRCGVLGLTTPLAGYLTKPFQPQDLHRILARFIEPMNGTEARR